MLSNPAPFIGTFYYLLWSGLILLSVMHNMLKVSIWDFITSLYYNIITFLMGAVFAQD